MPGCSDHDFNVFIIGLALEDWGVRFSERTVPWRANVDGMAPVSDNHAIHHTGV